MVLAFVMMVIGCDNGTTDNGMADNGSVNENGGIFTLNNIPSEYNGKFATLYLGDEDNSNIILFGGQSFNVSTGNATFIPISNGSVRLPMWILVGENLIRYSGNETYNVWVHIFDGSYGNLYSSTASEEQSTEIGFASVKFTNGSAVKNFNDNFHINYYY